MKFIDSVMSPGITPSWKAREIIDNYKKEIRDEPRKEEEK